MASQEPGIVAKLNDVLRCATMAKECAFAGGNHSCTCVVRKWPDSTKIKMLGQIHVPLGQMVGILVRCYNQKIIRWTMVVSLFPSIPPITLCRDKLNILQNFVAERDQMSCGCWMAAHVYGGAFGPFQDLPPQTAQMDYRYAGEARTSRACTS
eukprot:SAG31_NODE_3632_length_4047_cov_1.708207_2_plen_153_part_00